MTDDAHDTEDGALAGLDLRDLTRPGLTELVRDDPDGVALAVAAELDAELVSDPAEVRGRLADAGPTGGRVLTLDGLRSLAGQLARSERILATTEDRMVETVGSRMQGPAATLALHPETIRSSAVGVLEARQAVADLEAELERIAEGPSVIAESVATSTSPELGADDTRVTEAEAHRRVATGVGIASVGVAIALGGVLAFTVGVLALVVLVIPAAAALWGVRHVRTSTEDADDRAVASANLAGVLDRTNRIYGDSLGPLSQERTGLPASGGGQRRLARGRLELARERLRSAERSWADLVGEDADPDDVGSVLRRHDPQFFSATDVVSETPQARAAAAHHRRVRAKWRVAWAALDRDPPQVAQAEAAIEALEFDGRTTIVVGGRQPRALVAIGDLREAADELASLATSRSVVVVRGEKDPSVGGSAEGAPGVS